MLVKGHQPFFNFLFNMSSSQQSQICVHSPRNTHTLRMVAFRLWSRLLCLLCTLLAGLLLFFGGSEKWKKQTQACESVSV